MIKEAAFKTNIATAPRVGIVDISIYTPENIETAEQIARKTGLSRRIIEEKFGIREKHTAAADEHAGDLAIKAARAIVNKVNPVDIDAVIYCGSPYKEYQVWPCAPKIQYELGLANAFAFEIMNMSAGFTTAIKVAKDMLVADPRLSNILLAGGCRESCIVDPANPRTRFMANFADGGAAMLLRKDYPENNVLESFIFTDGSLYRHVRVPAGGSVLPASKQTISQNQHYVDVLAYEDMKSRLNAASTTNFVRVIREALNRSGFAGIKPDFLALLHLKPSLFKNILNALDMDESQSYYLNNYGHMSSLDIGFALHKGLQLGRIRQGHLVIAASSGTGYTWGATVIKWGKCS